MPSAAVILQVENGLMRKRAKGVSHWVCKQCDYTTRHRGHFNQHMVVHSDKKPFECSLCHTAFSRRATLANHLYLHGREKKFQCRFCPMAFHARNALEQHVCTHLTA
ncbi:uncharacterized protein LOC144107598 isoform X2 [Amblyomma americanum]